MNRFGVLLCLLLVMVLPYLMVALVAWSWSPAEWSAGARLVMAVLYLAPFYVLALYLLLWQQRRDAL
ncbi:hypothetical protein D9M70_405720 [compost metagenome]